jgi:6-phosphofructokinase 2
MRFVPGMVLLAFAKQWYAFHPHPFILLPMTDILTLTMNPALDVSTATETVMDTHKLRCTAGDIHPGGGGINVARVVQRLGADCFALYPAGGLIGQQLTQFLVREQVRGHCIPIAGDTRENFTAHELSSGRDFRFVLPGPVMTPPEWQACLDYVGALAAFPPYLVASGSLPPGVPDDFYARLAQLVKARGSRMVLDTSGAALAAALDEGVYLVKPSLRELHDLTGRSLGTEVQWREAAQQIIHSGQAQVVALSLGEEGALLVTADRALRAQSLPVKVRSTIGAGDSFVGGLVWALNRGTDLEEAFRYGMASGAAAVLSAGTALCQARDVERLHGQVVITSALDDDRMLEAA